jgi:hypothetical protein
MEPVSEEPRWNRSRDHGTEPDRIPKPEPSPAGTRRRLQALAARSWSPRAIEKETGIAAWLIQRELDGYDELAPELAGDVAAAYDRLWDQRPPNATAADRRAAAETAAHAARSGWAPPMAWDDDRIDLPGGRPEPGWRPSKRVRWRAVDIAEDAEFVRKYDGLRDATTREVATRLGIERDHLEQSTIRARRYGARRAERAARDAEPEAEAG